MTSPRLTRPDRRAVLRFLARHGQTLVSGLILSVAATLFVLGCGGGKDGVVTNPPPTTGTPTTGTPTTTTGGVDFNAFPEKVLLTERTSRGAVELKLSVAPTRPLSIILFQASPDPELRFDVDARYTGFGLGARSAGEFVPYLRMSVSVTNTATNEASEVELVPVIGLSKGLHYARNLRLPGPSPTYTVRLRVLGPEQLTAGGGGGTAVAYSSDLTPAGISGTVIQPNFNATYTANLVVAELNPSPTTTTTTTTTGTPTTGTPTTGTPTTTTTGGYGQ